MIVPRLPGSRTRSSATQMPLAADRRLRREALPEHANDVLRVLAPGDLFEHLRRDFEHRAARRLRLGGERADRRPRRPAPPRRRASRPASRRPPRRARASGPSAMKSPVSSRCFFCCSARMSFTSGLARLVIFLKLPGARADRSLIGGRSSARRARSRAVRRPGPEAQARPIPRPARALPPTAGAATGRRRGSRRR